MILCCGEALIDMLPRETPAGEPAFAPYPGGAVFNTAVALGRLGAPVGFFSGISTDLFGTMLTDALAASGVGVTHVATSHLPTTLAFVTLRDGQASYAFYDENTAGRMLTPADLPETDAEALFFGGISLVGEPCGSTFESLALREAGRRLIVLDPNIRPDFVTNADAYRARIGRMADAADIVKVSDDDLAWIAGDITPDAFRARHDLSLLLVTRGGAGAHVLHDSGTFDVAAHRVAVVDTVGAGDTFNGGVLAGLSAAGLLDRARLQSASRDQIAGAVDLGARAAAVTVSRAGADPPWKSEL